VTVVRLVSILAMVVPFASSQQDVQNGSKLVETMDKSDDGPDDRGKHYPGCRKDALFVMQSPIDILTDEVQFDSSLEPVDLRSYGIMRNDISMTLVNNGGHTAMVRFKGRDLLTIYDGSLPHTYSLDQLTFHLGHDGSRGVDYTLLGTQAPAELHLVHHPDGMDDTDGYRLSVIGFLFEISSTKNKAMEHIVRHFSNITIADRQVVLPPFILSDLLPPMRDGRLISYFRYFGNLTTPPCKSAIWTVAKDRIPISKEQLAKFRTLREKDNNPIGDVYRPTQPMNKRLVRTQTTPRRAEQQSGSASPDRHVGDPVLLGIGLALVCMSHHY